MIVDYVLRIACTAERTAELSRVLGVEPTEVGNGHWSLELSDRGGGGPVPFVDVFVGLLEGKRDRLAELGIAPEDVSVWIYCEYSDQCNLLFLASDLKRLGEEKMDLCISCWQVEECQEA